MKEWNKNTNAITEAQKLKERKQVMRTMGHQKETSSLTWVLLLFFSLLHEANKVAAKKKKARERERDTHTHSERQESKGWQAGRQTTTRKRPEGSTASCSDKAGEREQSDGLWALRRRKSGKLRGSERNKRDIYRGRDELRALDSTDKHYIQWSVKHIHTSCFLFFSSRLLLSSLVHRGQGPADSGERERERERAGVQWSITIISISVPLVIQGGFLLENL